MIFPLGRAANPAEPRLLEDRITANQKIIRPRAESEALG
jgi:hypothetical protein